MVPVNIREATVHDIQALLLFEQGVISAERPFDPTLKDHPTHYYELQEMIDDPEVHLLVGELDGKLVASGYARIKKAKPYLKHGSYAYLGFMYVLPEHRGKGINAKIIGALNDWARAKGLSETRLEVYYKNEPAIRAYEKTGFAAHMIEMRMPL